MFLHLFIVNKSGSLNYSRALSPKAPYVDPDSLLRLGSTLHALHAMAAEASPLKCRNGTRQNTNPMGADDGIEEVVADGMILRCLQTRTGLKFVLTAESSGDGPQTNLDSILREIYVLYTEACLKDPFYELDNLIKSEMFTRGVDNLIQQRMEKTTRR